MIDNLVFSKEDNYISNLYEMYELEYNLYLAEQEAFRAFSIINTQVIQESYYDLELIQESIKETLITWVSKFADGLQKALNKFVSIIDGPQDSTYLKSIKQSVDNLREDPGFTVDNIRNYDENKLHNFQIVDFTTAYGDKDSLQSQDSFLIRFYPDYFSEGKTNIKEQLEAGMVKTITDPVNATAELIRGYYNWCVNDYKTDLEGITKNINSYNNSTKSIQNVVNELPDDFRKADETNGNDLVTPKTAPVNGKQESALFLFHEAETTTPMISNTPGATNNSKNPDANKMTFNNDENFKSKTGGNNQEVVNCIKNYLVGTTKIISTLFMIVKNRKSDYLRVLKHTFPVSKEIRGATEAETQILNKNAQTQVNTQELQNKT